MPKYALFMMSSNGDFIRDGVTDAKNIDTAIKRQRKRLPNERLGAVINVKNIKFVRGIGKKR